MAKRDYVLIFKKLGVLHLPTELNECYKVTNYDMLVSLIEATIIYFYEIFLQTVYWYVYIF